MTLKEYIAELNRQYQTGVAREHTYRPALQNLLDALLPELIISNEPARRDCGAPDYILLRQSDHVPVAFIEAKDINDPDLRGLNKNKEQFDRYKRSLDNIIFTDYLNFLFYENGELTATIAIAKLVHVGADLRVCPIKENADKFQSLIQRFGAAQPQTLASPAQLAAIMAGKAQLMAQIIEKILSEPEPEPAKNSSVQGSATLPTNALFGQMEAFKKILINDITPKEFADVYAQTIVYGMFAARIHDNTPDNFSRREAAELIPKTNPFLRQLFQNIAGFDLDDRISWIVDDLAETFRAADVFAIMKGFGNRTRQHDPIIHFYEDFLSAYDPKLRKSRGVWYTPLPVVNFIVRAVDDILITDFNLPMGLADTSTTRIKVQNQKIKKRDPETFEQTVHKVQILDPATGTGTFLAETVSQIYEKFHGQTGLWQSYVEQHLLPRLHGFELLMASYAMAHLKLDLLLSETGYRSSQSNNRRLRIFLTNSLEEHHKDTGTIFAQFLASESNQANFIKRDTPVMVVIGNPPYSVSSCNKGEWINSLLDCYKQNLNERNIQPLSDDYIKFIRYGQHYIERNGEGILAYISNNSFIDGLIHRQMRKNLLQTFDKIYILDLHGNAKKMETAPDGSKDENVFDIQQGVSINIFIKNPSVIARNEAIQNPFATVYHFDLYGKRSDKYNYLSNNALNTIPWQKLNFDNTDPNCFFVPKDFAMKEEYEKGFKIDDLFAISTSGIVTHDDANLVSFAPFPDNSQKYVYRPFDNRYINYDLKKVQRHRFEVMKEFLLYENIGLLTCRQQSTFDFQHVFVSNHLTDKCAVSLQTKETTYVFPLYLFRKGDVGEGGYPLPDTKIPNLNPAIINQLSTLISLPFFDEQNPLSPPSHESQTFSPIDLFDYIYAVLHSPTYRQRYKEFLKIDFPRIPYPYNAEMFRNLSSYGAQLRHLHLMDNPILLHLITQYPIPGNNSVESIRYTENADGSTVRVWINETQYFDNVPTVTWSFYIGGYQPAQKWLKDRKGRPLSFDDLLHYQRIIVALSETNNVMREIDEIYDQHQP